MVFRPSGKFRGHPVLYRDHRKGPGGPPGGATHPGGPQGPKWGGEPALSGLVRPLGPPPAPRVETLGWGGGRPTCLGGYSTPLGRRPLGRLDLPGPAPPLGAYVKGGGRGQPHPEVLAPPPPATPLPPPSRAWRSPPECCCSTTTTPLCCCWSHHHQPLLPPCWIKKEETSHAPYVC